MKRTLSGWRLSRLRMSTSALAVSCALTGALTLTSAPNPAQACGGFFCSVQQPVNQAAERIIFINHEDGRVTMIVQVLYQGPSEQFSWVLPVVGVPDVSVSSNVAFTRLQSATNPNYTLTTEVEGTCAADTRSFGGPFPGAVAEDSDFNAGPPDAPQDPDVTVVGAGSVGPYNYEIISVNDELEDPAQVAIDWLTENGYDVGQTGPDVLRPYLVNGMNLLAFQLRKESSSGEIRPVVMTWEPSPMGMGQGADGRPAIPIRPTAVAANDDMGVMVWTVGGARAIPFNYRSLVINEAVLNWFNASSNYNDVINQAADEAGGHGFVTEMAQPSSRVENVVWSESEEADWTNLKNQSFAGSEASFLANLWRFSNWDGLAEAFRTAEVPLPEGVSYENLAGCPGCYYGNGEIPGLDVEALKAAIDENVVEPMRATQEMLTEREYVTRLYTTMSADEMDEDPVFDYNSERGDIDNQHNATRVIECRADVFQSDAPWRVALPQGGVVRGAGQTWPVSASEDMPANLRVEQERPMGEPQIIVDNSASVATTLEEMNSQFPTAIVSCTCAEPGQGTSGVLATLGVLGLVGLGLRRRRR